MKNQSTSFLTADALEGISDSTIEVVLERDENFFSVFVGRNSCGLIFKLYLKPETDRDNNMVMRFVNWKPTMKTKLQTRRPLGNH